MYFNYALEQMFVFFHRPVYKKFRSFLHTAHYLIVPLQLTHWEFSILLDTLVTQKILCVIKENALTLHIFCYVLFYYLTEENNVLLFH